MDATQINPKRRNYLLKVLKVQEVYLEHKQEGVTDVHVFRTYIEEQFFICERTFRKYLGINAKRELKQIKEYLKTHDA